jgi:hypothetical protein
MKVDIQLQLKYFLLEKAKELNSKAFNLRQVLPISSKFQ